MGSGQDIVVDRDPWVPSLPASRPRMRDEMGLGDVRTVHDILLEDRCSWNLREV